MQGRDIKRGKVTGTERHRKTQKDREEQVEEKKHYRCLTGFLWSLNQWRNNYWKQHLTSTWHSPGSEWVCTCYLNLPLLVATQLSAHHDSCSAPVGEQDSESPSGYLIRTSHTQDTIMCFQAHYHHAKLWRLQPARGHLCPLTPCLDYGYFS